MTEPEKTPPQERAEIERWIQRYSDAWQTYDDIETGKSFVSVSHRTRDRLKDAISLRFREATAWLREHSMPDSALDDDAESKTFCLPADWMPPTDL